jgi:hypothetical protein
MTGIGPSPSRLAGEIPNFLVASFAFFAAIHCFGCGCAALRSRRKPFRSPRPDRLRVAAHQHTANLAAVSFAVCVDPLEHRGYIRELVSDGLHYFNQIVGAVLFFFEIA